MFGQSESEALRASAVEPINEFNVSGVLGMTKAANDPISELARR
jgi:hypothetical protein